tara:strand:- start:6374 stop:8356 length:1983 start_codon:yes stop_codon:yes gene_type:complete
MVAYTPANNIKKIATGDESGTWGDSTNNNFDILDRASNGFYTLDIQTLDTSGSGTAGSSANPYVLPLSPTALLSIGHYKALRLISSGTLIADTHLKLEGDNNARVYMMQNDTTANTGINIVVFQGTFSASRAAEVAKEQFAILLADGSGASTSSVRHVTEDISPLTKALTIIDGTADASTPQLTVESTNTTGLSGPFINLERNPSEVGTANDFLGGVLFTGYNAATGTPEKIVYGAVQSRIKSPTDGSENGELNFYVASGGSPVAFLELGHESAQAEVVVNTAGGDVDFRVQGDTLPNLFGTEASTDKVLAGTNAARVSGPANHLVQVEGDSNHPAGISVTQSQTTTAGPLLTLAKSNNGTIGSSTIVADGDTLGTISFAGDDGVDLANVGAEIKTVVDGTPDVNDIPAAMEFRTTAATESTPTTHLKIFNDGAVRFTSDKSIGVGTSSPSSTGGAAFSILTSRGPDASPQWSRSPSAMEFIHSVTISDQPYVFFGLPNDEYLPAPRDSIRMFNFNAFDSYVFELVSVVPVTDGAAINAEAYVSGIGVTPFFDTGANYKLNNTAQTSFKLNGGGGIGSDAYQGLTQSYTLHNAGSLSHSKPFIPSNGGYHSTSGHATAGTLAMSYANGEVVVSGIRFGAASGNLSTGRIRMYGIRKSFDY